MYEYEYHICFALSLLSHVKPACFLLPQFCLPYHFPRLSFDLSCQILIKSSYDSFMVLRAPKPWKVFEQLLETSLVYEISLQFSIIMFHESYLWQPKLWNFIALMATQVHENKNAPSEWVFNPLYLQKETLYKCLRLPLYMPPWLWVVYVRAWENKSTMTCWSRKKQLKWLLLMTRIFFHPSNKQRSRHNFNGIS